MSGLVGADGVRVSPSELEVLRSPPSVRDLHECPACATEGRNGSCARLRCYCGHQEYWAFDSYYKPEAVNAPIVRKADKRMAKSWAEREEPTWLDR